MNITRQQIYNVVREAGARIGLKGKCIMNPETGRTHNVHPHNLRDSLAVHWLQVAGSDVNKQKALQDQLGHVSFATTMRYDKLSPAMVRKVADEVRKARFQK
jgi:integrase/recombinase XerD